MVDGGAALASGYIFVGNSSGVATGVAVTGDISLSNAGVAAISAGVIVDADVKSDAAIAMSKLANTYATTSGITFRDVAVNSGSAGRLDVNGILFPSGFIYNTEIRNPNGTGIANPVKIGGINISSGSDAPSGGADGDMYMRINGATTLLYVNINGSWVAQS